MDTKDSTFQPENFVPGIFLGQGLAGGMLAGFALMFATTLWTDGPDVTSFFLATPVVMLVGGTAGVIMATIIWEFYSLLGIQMPVTARIIVTVITIRLITMFFGLRWVVDDGSQLALGIAIAILTGLPIALLVGSAVKPWQIFTFGTIATGRPELERHVGSYSILGTLGTLPLRFLSIVALAAWLLYVSSQREMGAGPTGAAAALLLPAIYPAFSAYVTFRTPYKTVLVWLGVLVNFPIALLAFFPTRMYTETFWFSGVLLHLSYICTAFLIAWTIFIIARLAAPTQNPILALDDVLRQRAAAKPLKTWEHERLEQRFGETRLISPGRYK
jgi:hypothetical protein